MARKSRKINLQEELLKRKSFSIPSIQKELGVGYKELRDCVSIMEKNGQAKLSDDDLNYVVDNTQSASKQSTICNSSSSTQGRQSGWSSGKSVLGNYERVDEEDIVRRRRELMERLAKLRVEDDEDDDDDDDDDDEDEYDEDHENEEDEEDEENEKNKDWVLMNDDSHLKKYASEANSCKLIDGINYCEEMLVAQKIVNVLDSYGFRLTLKAIQYGTASTGFVFEFPSQEKAITDLPKLANDIKFAIVAIGVKIVAPWGHAMVYVWVKDIAKFDPFCKRALNYWIAHDDGCASIASIQRGLGIGFYRAAVMMDCLQKIGCVESISPSDDASKPLRVNITEQEIDILFPKFLGWD